MTFFSESDYYRERSLNIQMSQVNKDKQYLVQYYAAMYCNYSSMRKVHLVKGHVVYVYWMDTVYVQNTLPIELSKRTIFIIYRKIC